MVLVPMPSNNSITITGAIITIVGRTQTKFPIMHYEANVGHEEGGRPLCATRLAFKIPLFVKFGRE